MFTRRIFLALIAIATLIPLAGCHCKKSCCGSSSFAPPPPPCNNCGGTVPQGFLPPAP